MAQDIVIGGRLHSAATGNTVAGANEILDDAKGKKQNVINQEVDNEIGSDSAAGTIKGRIKNLETAVGSGGSVDERIAETKDEIIGDAATDYNTLGKVEDKIQETKSEILGDAASDYNTLGKVEDKIQAETSRAEAAEGALDNAKANKATTLDGYGIIDAYTKSETYTKTEVNGLVDTPHQNYVTVLTYAALIAIDPGSTDTIYRVSNYDGSVPQVDVTKYSEYAWDGTQYVFLCVKSQIDEVFDISVYNNNATYADLAAALGTDGANVPQTLRRGGMSVKFVHSVDNKYVQYRLMSDTFNTTEANWQGVDDEPTAGSYNLTESDGTFLKLQSKVPVNSPEELFDKSTVLTNKSCVGSTGVVREEIGWSVSPLISVASDVLLWISTYNLYVYNTNESFVKKYANVNTKARLKDFGSEITADNYLIRLEFRTEDLDSQRVATVKESTPISGYAENPSPFSYKLATAKGVGLKMLQEVPIKSDDELFDRSTTLVNTDLNNNGEEIYNENYCASPFIPMNYTTVIWVTAYKNKVFVYDSSKNYLGDTGYTEMRGKSLSNISSSFSSAAYIRIVFSNALINEARVGLTEKENLVKDYFDYNSKAEVGNNGIVLSEGICESIFDKYTNLSVIHKEDFNILLRNGSSIVGIDDTFTKIDFITKIVNNSHINLILSTLDGIQAYAAVYGTYDKALGAATVNEIERITTNSWTSNNVQKSISHAGYININVRRSDSGTITKQQLNNILNNIVIDIDKSEERSYYLHDWINGDWSNGNDGPYLTRRTYKLRTGDWLHFKKGTVIEGFLNNSGRTAFVDMWDESTGEVVDIDTRRTTDFKLVVPMDVKALIWTTSSLEYPKAIDQVVDFRITTNNEKLVNKISFLKIATFNPGDYAYDNPDIVRGSEEDKTLTRGLLSEIDANIIGSQEDVMYFDPTNHTLPRNEVFGMFKYGDVLALYGVGNSEANNNFHGYYSDYKLNNIRRVSYDLTEQEAPMLGHYYFGAAELIIDGKIILVCNVHFDWSDKNVRAKQIQQVLSYCQKYEYSIILGDTNPENREVHLIDGHYVSEWVDPNNKMLYETEWQIFVNAGYSMANGGYLGYFNTCNLDGTNWYPYDNIFVSSNIQIKKSWMVDKDWLNDHKPVVAELVIY